MPAMGDGGEAEGAKLRCLVQRGTGKPGVTQGGAAQMWRTPSSLLYAESRIFSGGQKLSLMGATYLDTTSCVAQQSVPKMPLLLPADFNFLP